VHSQIIENSAYSLLAEPTAFPQRRRPARAMQSEHRFTTAPYDVDMCGPVVVRIDDDAQAPKTQDGWHISLYHNPSVWVSRRASPA